MNDAQYSLKNFYNLKLIHCVKSVQIRIFSGPYFPAFGLNRGKYGPEKTPYLDTFHAVIMPPKAGIFHLESGLFFYQIYLFISLNYIFFLTDFLQTRYKSRKKALFFQNFCT